MNKAFIAEPVDTGGRIARVRIAGRPGPGGNAA